MPDINTQNGMFNSKPKRKGRADINWPPITKNWPDLEKGEIPRPCRIESVSLVDLANYVVHYQNVFPSEVIDQFNDEAWILSLGYRLTSIVSKFYNGSALARRRDNNLCREMVDELTAKGGGYEFFRKFAGNWFAHKLLQLRYKTHRYQRDRAARGIARSTQRPEGKIQHQGKKMRLPDKVKDSNAGGRAASHLNDRPGRPLTLSQMRYCCGCVEFKDSKDWKDTEYEACGLHPHDDSGMMIGRPESTRSTRSHNCAYDSGRIVVPSENNSNSRIDKTHWENDSVNADIVNLESDIDADYNNRRSDCNDSPFRHQLSTTTSQQSTASEDSLQSLERNQVHERSCNKDNDEQDVVEDGLESEGDVECNLGEIDTEPLRNQLQQDSTVELVQKIIEQAESIRVMRAALDRSSQQPNQWNKTYRRRLSSSPQASREEPCNTLWDQPAQNSKGLGQRKTPHRVSKSPVSAQSIGNSRYRQELSQIQRRIVPLKTRSRQATSQVVPVTASAVEETRPRTRSRKPLSSTSYSLPSGRS